MFKKFLNKYSSVVAVIIFALTFIACYAISWIATCGVIKAITMCFGLTFTWSIATGIWLVMCLARTVFKSSTTVKK